MKAKLGKLWIDLERYGPHEILLGGKRFTVDSCRVEPGVYSLIVDGRSYLVSVNQEKNSHAVWVSRHLVPVRLEASWFPADPHGPRNGHRQETLCASMPGRVVGIKVTEGQEVQEGQGLLLLEAMKMENELLAPAGGRVASIEVKVGDVVSAGQELVRIE